MGELIGKIITKGASCIGAIVGRSVSSISVGDVVDNSVDSVGVELCDAVGDFVDVRVGDAVTLVGP